MQARTVEVEWEGRVVSAWVPAPLRSMPPLDPTSAAAAAHATGVLRGAAGLGDPRLEVAARLLLRAEGVASSHIEAIHAPADLVAVAELDGAVGGPAAAVADNLRALDEVLVHDGPLEPTDLRRWHRTLMASSELDPAHVGAWRDRLGWVGGATPLRAAHVAPPAERIDGLIGDLVAFANREADDPVTQAALVHAQFEVIHPFADGNGRLGRLLVHWVLRRRLGLVAPPPISERLLRDVGGYLSGLTLYRTTGPDPWVRWFAGTVEAAASSAATTLGAVAALLDGWPERVRDLRRDAAAKALLDHLPTHVVLDVQTAARLLGVSDRAAANAIAALEARGVLRSAELGATGRPGRPRRWWAAGELLDLLVR